jgi:hypothetical protein
MPNLSGGSNVSLTIESDPPGADARVSTGASCRTPCMIPVPADREFSVSYSLNGYRPQTIAVRPGGSSNFGPDVAAVGPEYTQPSGSAELSPNPVYAQLEPAPPPAPPARKKGGRPKQKQPPKQ